MNDSLKAGFTKDELELAGAIGQVSEKSLEERIEELFRELPDPLLSADDAQALLGLDLKKEELVGVLGKLCGDGVLEKSDKTLRPLDKEGTILYRLAEVPFARLKLIGIEAAVGTEGSRLQFTCDGRLIRSIARVDRLDAISGQGQQRDEIVKHVKEIADGILAGTQVPNSILLVLLESQTARVGEDDEDGDPPDSFIQIRPVTDWIEIGLPSRPDTVVQRFRQVEIDFPYRRAAFDDEKSGVLVDGQQRTAALSQVDVDKVPHFALSVNAVITDPEEAKRVFQVANTTVKIATQFSRALLATMDEAPGYLKAERARAVAAQLLSLSDPSSPFHALVRYPGGRKQKPRPPIAYNSLFRVVSTFADSALPLQEDAQALAQVVGRSFNLVKEQWPTAWGKKPTVSRLMHGVGLRATASLLASKLETQYQLHGSLDGTEVWDAISASLERLKPRLVWTDEEAAQASTAVRKIWRDEISNRQNTNQDIAALTSFLKKESLHLDSEAQKVSKAKK